MNPTTAVAGLGRGWTRVAEAVGKKVPAADIARIWVFSPIQREDREWGTAVVARHADAERVVIYTARYVLVTRGKERGQGVGYLEDGTMVVAEGGRDHIGETVELTVTSVLQTSAGRMIFGRSNGDEHSDRRRHRTARSD